MNIGTIRKFNDYTIRELKARVANEWRPGLGNEILRAMQREIDRREANKETEQ